VSDAIVAACALESFRFAAHYVSIDRRCDRFVAPATGVLHHLVIELGDLDRVRVSAAREMKECQNPLFAFTAYFPTML
jgi:hypothetical protein